MQAIQLKDHLAYQFEKDETVFAIAQKVMLKQKLDSLLEGIEIACNGKPRIVYNIQTVKPLLEVIQTIDSKVVYQVLMQFLNLILKFEENDFLQKEAIDVNIYHMYFEMETQQLKCCALPVNSEFYCHDQKNWQAKYRQTLATLLKMCFKDAPRGYTEVYSKIFDGVKNDIEIAHFLQTCDYQWYGLGSSVTGKEFTEHKVVKVEKEVQENKTIMRLECISHAEQRTININVEPFTLGSQSGDAMGKIRVGALSRNHCTIKMTNDVLTVIDNKSTNGSFINGFRLNPGVAYVIKNGDTLKLADVEFLVKING